MASGRNKKAKSPTELPQLPESWFVLVRRLRMWVEDSNGQHIRPYLLIAVNRTGLKIHHSDLLQIYPTPETVRSFLWKAVSRPPKPSLQKPHRPQEVRFEDREYYDSVSPALNEIGINTLFTEPDELINSLTHEVETSLVGDEPEPPTLLSVPGTTSELLSEFFSAAADYYRAEPWIALSDMQPVAIHIDPPGRDVFVQLMGNAGMEYGLILYWKLNDLEHSYLMLSSPEKQIPEGGWFVLSFESIEYLPFGDIEAIESYKWEIASDKAYPLPIVYYTDSVERPDRETLIIQLAILRAIPRFTQHHLEPDLRGDYIPAEANFQVRTIEGTMDVRIKYPALTLPLEALPSSLISASFLSENEPFNEQELFEDESENDEDYSENERDDDLGLSDIDSDQKSLEDDIDIILEMTFGRSDPDSPSHKAYSLIIQAWEETDQRKRISLAQEALKIYPDCADAYVILAHDFAVNIGQSLRFAQKGVEAGERALGKGFFEENIGKFGEYPEALPYLRARMEQAVLLTFLNRKTEAIEHFRELLTLDPYDDMDLRFHLLNLLMTLNRDNETQDLLNQYPDDDSIDWLYSQALITFRKAGNSMRARKSLEKAQSINSEVPAYLTGIKQLPSESPSWSIPDAENEAIFYASSYLDCWQKTPGAIAWLKNQTGPTKTIHRDTLASKKRRRGA